MKEWMTIGDIINGLKHYRRIAKQDLLAAELTDCPDIHQTHAVARREIYGLLMERAKTVSNGEVLEYALELYESLPLVSGTGPGEYADIKGQEAALENFFLMINLEPKVRRELRKRRKRIEKYLVPA